MVGIPTYRVNLINFSVPPFPLGKRDFTADLHSFALMGRGEMEKMRGIQVGILNKSREAAKKTLRRRSGQGECCGSFMRRKYTSQKIPATNLQGEIEENVQAIPIVLRSFSLLPILREPFGEFYGWGTRQA